MVLKLAAANSVCRRSKQCSAGASPHLGTSTLPGLAKANRISLIAVISRSRQWRLPNKPALRPLLHSEVSTGLWREFVYSGRNYSSKQARLLVDEGPRKARTFSIRGALALRSLAEHAGAAQQAAVDTHEFHDFGRSEAHTAVCHALGC